MSASKKRCITCGDSKNKAHFYIKRENRDGLTGECKLCKIQREHNRRTLDPNLVKRDKLMRNFGMTLETYHKKLKAQGQVCAICRQPEKRISSWTKKPMMLSVDHRHKDGKVRDLLCSPCNHALGNLKEDIGLFKAAIAYLKKHNK